MQRQYSSRQQVDQSTFLPLRRAYLALAALSIGFFMNLMDQSIVSVALPDIMAEFGVDYATVIWVASAYFLALVIPILVTGRLGDQLGQRNMYVWGVALFTLASLWCGLASSISSLVIARFCQGIGGAMAVPQTLAVITRVFAPEKRGPAMGIWGTVAGLATLAGPLLGGYLVTAFGWEWIFFVNVPLGIICIFLSIKWIPVLPTASHRFDIPGIIFSILGISAIVIGIQQGESSGWRIELVGLLVAGLVALAIFIKLQSTAGRRRVEALVPLSLFADRNFSLGSLSITAMGFAVASNALPIMLYLQQVEQFSALQAGLVFAPMSLLSAVLAPYVGKLIGRWSARTLNMIGFATMVAGNVMMCIALRPEHGIAWTLFGSVVLGIGHSFVWAPNSTITMYDVGPHMAGAASGVYNTARQVGAVLGSAATAAFMQARVNSGSGSEMFGQVLLMQAAALLVGLIAVTGFRRPGARR